MFKKCSTDQSCIRKEVTSYKLGTLNKKLCILVRQIFFRMDPTPLCNHYLIFYHSITKCNFISFFLISRSHFCGLKNRVSTFDHSGNVNKSEVFTHSCLIGGNLSFQKPNHLLIKQHPSFKGGLISKGIFNLVLSSEEITKSLSSIF